MQRLMLFHVLVYLRLVYCPAPFVQYTFTGTIGRGVSSGPEGVSLQHVPVIVVSDIGLCSGGVEVVDIGQPGRQLIPLHE